nr:hypothetical protein [Schaalia odontolytica]
MIFGETVQLKVRRTGSLDEFGNERAEYMPAISLRNVLVAPSSSQDLGADRPDGDATIMTFHFPKTYIGQLKGCLIGWKARWWEVIGDPQPYAKDSTPGVWNRPAQAKLVEG